MNILLAALNVMTSLPVCINCNKPSGTVKASDAIVHWKAHVMRAVNQERTKQDILA